MGKGWDDVGYHGVIQPCGEWQQGRAFNVQGAHCYPNKGLLGICFIGTDKFNMEQFDTLRYYLDGIIQMYDISPWDIWGHYEYDSAKGKTCPNIRAADITAWYIGHYDEAIYKYLT